MRLKFLFYYFCKISILKQNMNSLGYFLVHMLKKYLFICIFPKNVIIGGNYKSYQGLMM